MRLPPELSLLFLVSVGAPRRQQSSIVEYATSERECSSPIERLGVRRYLLAPFIGFRPRFRRRADSFGSPLSDRWPTRSLELSVANTCAALCCAVAASALLAPLTRLHCFGTRSLLLLEFLYRLVPTAASALVSN